MTEDVVYSEHFRFVAFLNYWFGHSYYLIFMLRYSVKNNRGWQQTSEEKRKI